MVLSMSASKCGCGNAAKYSSSPGGQIGTVMTAVTPAQLQGDERTIKLGFRLKIVISLSPCLWALTS
jgi:hypothetical protein